MTMTLEEIQAQKDALLNAAKGNMQNSTNVYQEYLDNAINRENQGALYSYNNNATTSMTDKVQSRSAYLNRKAKNSEAYAEAKLLNSLNDKTYGAYLDAAGLNAQADVDSLKYQDAVYRDTMDYQKERDKISDEQWQKEYDLQLQQYYNALASGASSGGYSKSYGSSGNDWTFSDTNSKKSSTIKDALRGAAVGALSNAYSSVPYYSRTDRYVIDDYGVYDNVLGKYVEKRK